MKRGSTIRMTRGKYRPWVVRPHFSQALVSTWQEPAESDWLFPDAKLNVRFSGAIFTGTKLHSCLKLELLHRRGRSQFLVHTEIDRDDAVVLGKEVEGQEGPVLLRYFLKSYGLLADGNVGRQGSDVLVLDTRLLPSRVISGIIRVADRFLMTP